MATEWKNPTIAFPIRFLPWPVWVSTVLSWHTGLGVVKIITCAGAGIWGITTIGHTAMTRAKKYNYNKLMMNF